MKIFFHTRSPEQSDCLNVFIDFAQIPSVGEYVAKSTDGPWYRVQLIVHTPFPCDCDAEVYAVRVDDLKVLKETLVG